MEPGCPTEDVLASYVRGALDAARAEPLREHLDDCDACSTSLLALVRGSRAGTEAAQPRGLEDVPATGTRIGRFTLERMLGHGAMGWVFVARDPELEREVAIKVLRDPAREVLREAKAMARLRHRNVLTIYEAGRDDDLGFIAMELVRGSTLRAAVTTERPPVTTLLGWLVQIARGVAAIHAAGLVHRDIKPDNIFVEPEGANGQRVVIGDLGLASTPETDAHAAGTPAYMAPEIMNGGALDRRADVFAFGVTAWELVTGTRPFAGRTLPELRTAIARGAKWPASTPALPRAAVQMIERCIAADPGARPASMDEVAEAFVVGPRARRGRVLLLAGVAVAGAGIAWQLRGGTAAASEPPCDPDAASTRIARRGTWLARASGLSPYAREAITKLMDERAEAWPRAAAFACVQSPLVQQTWRTCRTQLEAQETALLSLAVERPWRDDTALPRVIERLERPRYCAGAQASAEVLAAARLPDDQARAQLAAGLVGIARAHALDELDATAVTAELDQVSSLATAIAPSPLDPALALARAQLAPPAETAARLEALRAAASLAESRGNSEVAANAWLAQLGQASDLHLDARAIDQALNQADWAITRLDNPPRLRARWLMRAAGIAWSRGDTTTGREHMRASAQLLADDPWMLASYRNLTAQLASMNGDVQDAAAQYERLLADDSLLASHDTLGRMGLHAAYSEHLYRLGKLPEALTQSAEARALAAQVLAPNDPEAITLIMSEAMIHLDKGDVATSERMMDEACGQLVTALGPDHRRVGECRLRRAYAQMLAGKHADALASAKDAVRINALIGVERTEEGLQARALLVDILALDGPLDDAALAAYAQIVVDAEAALGTAHPSWAQHATGYATALSARDRDDDAAVLLERVVPALVAAHIDPTVLASSQFALARALRKRDPRRARTFAEAAEIAWRDAPGSEEDHRKAVKLVGELATQ